MVARNGFQPGGDIFFDGGDSGRYVEDDIAVSILGANAATFYKVQATDPTQPSGYATWVNNDGSDVGRPETATGDSVVIKRWSGTVSSEAMPAPVFVSIAPSQGDVLGGTPVVVTVADAVNIDVVKVGGVPLVGLAIASQTTLTGTTGPHAAGLADVEVVNAGGTDTQANAFTFVQSTPVTAVSVAEGDEAGGTIVDVTVGDSSLVTAIYFGSSLAGGLTILDATHVRVTTPAGAPGSVAVSANVPNSLQSLASGFTYTFSLSARPTNVWLLDETSGTTVADVGSPGGLVGTHQSAVLVNQDGKVGRSARYNNTGANGMTGRTAFGNVLSFERTQPFSACGWVRSTTTGNGAIMGRMQPGPNYPGWQFEVVGGGTQFDFYLINNYFGPNMLWIRGTGLNFQDGSWKHWAVTYDGSSTPGGVQLYGNGALLAMATQSNTLSATIIAAGNRFNLGSRSNDVSADMNPWPGYLDENAFFLGSVLSAADILKIYNEANAGASIRYAR